MQTPLQEAVGFFYDKIGRRIMECEPAASYLIKTDGVCDVCGREGEGYFDNRAHHKAMRCMACASLYWNAPSIFVEGGNDRSFSFISAQWLLDASGTLVIPTGKQFTKQLTRVTARRVGIEYVEHETPKRFLLQKLASGAVQPPLLWVCFSRNKLQAIQCLRLGETTTLVPFCDQGVVYWYDFKAIREILACAKDLDKSGLARLDEWIAQGIPDDPLAAFRARKELRALGMDNHLHDASAQVRSVVKSLLGR